MAIRRAKQKAQVIKRLSEVAPPGETFIACVYCETGPSPWLNGVFGLLFQLSRNMYFLTLTNTSVVVNTASRLTNRPGGVVVAFPRESVPISDVERGAVWSKLYLQFPHETKPTRLNVHRYWRGELDQLVAAIPATSAYVQA